MLVFFPCLASCLADSQSDPIKGSLCKQGVFFCAPFSRVFDHATVKTHSLTNDLIETYVV